jgi:hypothetical protein
MSRQAPAPGGVRGISLKGVLIEAMQSPIPCGERRVISQEGGC